MSPDKLLVGLPVQPKDAGSGYIPVEQVVSEIIEPIQLAGPFGGLMNWQFSSDTGGNWGKTVAEALNSLNSLA